METQTNTTSKRYAVLQLTRDKGWSNPFTYSESIKPYFDDFETAKAHAEKHIDELHMRKEYSTPVKIVSRPVFN